MAGFTLNLTLGGLCLMVPDFERAKRQLHVLLPRCEHDGVPHVPFVTFDQAADTQGKQPTRLPTNLMFPGAEFDLSSQASIPQVDRPPAAVANLTQVFGIQIPVTFLDSNTPGPNVNSRVRFAAGTSQVPPCGAGAFWFFPDGFDPYQNPDPAAPQLPIRASWTMHVDAAFLDVQFTDINGSGFSSQLRLYPWEETLDLWVFNSPQDLPLPTTFPPLNFTGEPDPLDRAEHFGCFYPLTDKPGETRVPVYHHLAAIPSPCFPTFGHPGLDVMCIAAQADPKP